MVRRLFLMPEDGPSPQGGEARIPGEDDRDYREPERKPTHSPAESTPRRRTFFSFAGDTDNSADEIVQRVVRETGAIDNAEEPLRSEEEPEIESFRRLRFSLLDEVVPEETVPEDDSGPVDEMNEIDGDREPEEDLEMAEAFEPDEEVEQTAAEVESVEEDDMAAEADETDDDLSSHDPLRVPIDEYDPELWDKMDHDMSADHTPDEVAEDVDGELDSSDTPEPENSDEEVDQNLEIAFEHDESVIHRKIGAGIPGADNL